MPIVVVVRTQLSLAHTSWLLVVTFPFFLRSILFTNSHLLVGLSDLLVSLLLDIINHINTQSVFDLNSLRKLKSSIEKDYYIKIN